MGETATASRATCRERVGEPRHGQERADRHDRVGRAHHDHRRRRPGRRAPRGRAPPLRRPRSEATRRRRRGGGRRSTPGTRPRDRRRSVSRVRTGSSDMGRRRTDTPRAGVISDVTSDNEAPSDRRWVRYRWVARSWSPRRNQVSPPRRSRLSMTPQVSPARPQPRSSSFKPGQGVGHRVEVGADVQAVEHGVVAGVDHRRDLVRRDDAHQAAEQAGGTYSSRQGGDHGARLTVRSASPRRPVCKARPVPADCATRPRAPPGGRRRHAPARRAHRGGPVLRGCPAAPGRDGPSSTWTPSR